MVIGLLTQLGVLILLAGVGDGSPIALVGVASIGNGLGQGLWNVPANSVMMGAMPPAALGVGGAFTNVTRTVGNVVGQAGATAIVAGVMAAQDFDVPLGEVADTPGAGAAFVDGWQTTFVVGALVTLVAVAIATRLPGRSGARARRSARV